MDTYRFTDGKSLGECYKIVIKERMMNKDLKIKIKIDSDTGELIVTKREFDKLGKSVQTTERYTDKFAKRLTTMAYAASGLYAINKAFDAIVSTTKEFVNTAAQFEQFNTVLKTLEGNATKAASSMAWITEFSKTTPYELSQVTESFVKLRAYGIDPTDGSLRTLGDTASAMGKTIDQAVEAMADAVVGENERLKEFGIRASKIGDQIKYTWTNASGEMRQTVIQNNSEIIQSTLEAIFNSKYAGAMEQQSRTWNGLISNMKDNWTIFQNNIMDSGVFDYLKAIVAVVGDYMHDAFDSATSKSGEFATYVIDGIRAVIKGFGSLYDSLETFGDYFSVVGDLAELGFWGFQKATSRAALFLVQSFEGAFNFVIDGINSILETIEAVSLGTITFGRVDHVSWSSDELSRAQYVDAKVEAAKVQLQKDWNDLMGTGHGASFANKFLEQVEKAYEKLKNSVDNQSEKTDFGEAVEKIKPPVSTEEATQKLQDYAVAQEEVQKTIEDVSKGFEELNDTLQSDTGDSNTYTAVNNVTDGFDRLNDVTQNTQKTIIDATKSIERFSFAFSSKLIDSFRSNIDALSQVTQTSMQTANISYKDALSYANEVKSELIKNPLDVTIGKRYQEAYNTLLSSVDGYLKPTNFQTQSEYAFAQATVGMQVADFQDTAIKAIDVFDSMNALLESINQAFEDGILTDEEKATISGVATSVNKKNEVLLGSQGVVGAIETQEYYNNNGLAKDASLQPLYKGEDITTTVANQISGYAKDASLIGSNSVSTFIKKLMGDGEKGISLARIESTLPELQVATGLDGDLSNIKIYTHDTKTAVDNANIKGKTVETLDNLRVKSVTTDIKNLYEYFVPNSYGDGGHWETGSYPPSNATNVTLKANEGSTTRYEYYAKGGFTGIGFGKRDETGEVPAGIVHAGEWVAPHWMIRENPALFGALEMHRLGKKIPSKRIDTTNTDSNTKIEKYLFVLADEMKQMNRLLRRVTDGGEAMKTEVVS